MKSYNWYISPNLKPNCFFLMNTFEYNSAPLPAMRENNTSPTPKKNKKIVEFAHINVSN